MKTLRLLFFLLIISSVNVFANDLTPTQKKAQRSVFAYFKGQKLEPSVDPSDNSVCFKQNGVLYWVTIDEEKPLLFTFNRVAFKIGNEEKDFQRNLAIIAANEVNAKHKLVKLTVLEKKVEIAVRVYASSAEEFTGAFQRYYKAFENVSADFKKAYSAALEAQQRAEEQAEAEARKNIKPSELRDMIESVSFSLSDAEGNVTSEYDKPLRSYQANYIKTRLTFQPWTKENAEFDLIIKVTKPNGKPIYQTGKKYSAAMTVAIKKSKKLQDVEFDEFGSTEQGFWKAGEYKVEIFESGDLIYTTTFNIL